MSCKVVKTSLIFVHCIESVSEKVLIEGMVLGKLQPALLTKKVSWHALEFRLKYSRQHQGGS